MLLKRFGELLTDLLTLSRNHLAEIIIFAIYKTPCDPDLSLNPQRDFIIAEILITSVLLGLYCSSNCESAYYLGQPFSSFLKQLVCFNYI